MSDSLKTDEYCQLFLENRLTYLYALVKNIEDFEEIKSYWKNLSIECQKRQSKKVLVETECLNRCLRKNSTPDSISELYTISNMFELGDFIARLDFWGIKIAYVSPRRDKQEFYKFCELVVANRGVKVKIFHETEDAEKWLVHTN